MTDRFMRVREVSEKSGLSRTEIYRRVDESRFPKPVKLGAKTNAWLESEFNAWLQAIIEETRGKANGKP